LKEKEKYFAGERASINRTLNVRRSGAV